MNSPSSGFVFLLVAGSLALPALAVAESLWLDVKPGTPVGVSWAGAETMTLIEEASASGRTQEEATRAAVVMARLKLSSSFGMSSLRERVVVSEDLSSSSSSSRMSRDAFADKVSPDLPMSLLRAIRISYSELHDADRTSFMARATLGLPAQNLEDARRRALETLKDLRSAAEREQSNQRDAIMRQGIAALQRARTSVGVSNCIEEIAAIEGSLEEAANLGVPTPQTESLRTSCRVGREWIQRYTNHTFNCDIIESSSTVSPLARLIEANVIREAGMLGLTARVRHLMAGSIRSSATPGSGSMFRVARRTTPSLIRLADSAVFFPNVRFARDVSDRDFMTEGADLEINLPTFGPAERALSALGPSSVPAFDGLARSISIFSRARFRAMPDLSADTVEVSDRARTGNPDRSRTGVLLAIDNGHGLIHVEGRTWVWVWLPNVTDPDLPGWRVIAPALRIYSKPDARGLRRWIRSARQNEGFLYQGEGEEWLELADERGRVVSVWKNDLNGSAGGEGWVNP